MIFEDRTDIQELLPIIRSSVRRMFGGYSNRDDVFKHECEIYFSSIRKQLYVRTDPAYATLNIGCVPDVTLRDISSDIREMKFNFGFNITSHNLNLLTPNIKFSFHSKPAPRSLSILMNPLYLPLSKENLVRGYTYTLNLINQSEISQ